MEVDPSLAGECLWALGYLCTDMTGVRRVMAAGVVPRLLHLLEDELGPVTRPAIRCLGNLLSVEPPPSAARLLAALEQVYGAA
jgi:hypothetical protein